MELLLPALFLQTAQRNICFYLAFSLLNVIVLFLTFILSPFDSRTLFQASRPSIPFNSSSDSMPNNQHKATLLDILILCPKIILSALLYLTLGLTLNSNTVLSRRESHHSKSCLPIVLWSNKHTY